MQIKVQPKISATVVMDNNGKCNNSQLEIRTKTQRVFVSYGTTIAVIDVKKNQVYLSEQYWNYSTTTVRYLCGFLKVSKKKVIQERIANGMYILADLIG